MTYQPSELEEIEREEQEARLRYEEHRERQRRSEGEAPKDHGLLERLENEWRRARERLHAARESTKE